MIFRFRATETLEGTFYSVIKSLAKNQTKNRANNCKPISLESKCFSQHHNISFSGVSICQRNWINIIFFALPHQQLKKGKNWIPKTESLIYAYE